MRPEKNPLDLNNLPDEYSRDGCRKKKNGLKDTIDECGKVYECRFCSLKFRKSQALGGHMNRHRQERETETLNQARQLVYSNVSNLSTQHAPHLGCCQPIASGGYHPSSMGDPTMRQRFPRYMSASSSLHMPPQVPPQHHQQPSQHFFYPSSPPPRLSFPSPYSHDQVVNDYYVGHVLRSGTNKKHSLNDYTCIGANIGPTFGKDMSLQNQEEALNWEKGYSGTQQQLDTHSVINRFQDGF